MTTTDNTSNWPAVIGYEVRCDGRPICFQLEQASITLEDARKACAVFAAALGGEVVPMLKGTE